MLEAGANQRAQVLHLEGRGDLVLQALPCIAGAFDDFYFIRHKTKGLFTAEARRRGVKNLPYDSLSQNRHIEINDESNRFAQQLQIGDELGFMDGEDSLDAF